MIFKKRVISREDGKAYLVRYYILRTPWFRVRLHHILLSDYDCLHDHPWNFLSVILWGGYYEFRDSRPFSWKPPGSILYRKAEDRHRLVLQKPAWTLVFMLKRRRQWGFYTKAGWIPWFKYRSTQSCE